MAQLLLEIVRLALAGMKLVHGRRAVDRLSDKTYSGLYQLGDVDIQILEIP